MGDDDPAKWERIRTIRRFCEKFHGRFTFDEAEAIVDNFELDVDAAVQFVLDASEQTIIVTLEKLKIKRFRESFPGRFPNGTVKLIIAHFHRDVNKAISIVKHASQEEIHSILTDSRIQNFQESLPGRFPNDEAKVIIEHFHGDVDQAASHVLNAPQEEIDAILKPSRIARFLKLSSGRFSNDEAEILVDHFAGDVTQAVAFILQASPNEIKEILGAERWFIVEHVRKDRVLQNVARRNEISAEFRQFSCRACNLMWWRQVPTRKPVARCSKCWGCYEPLSRDKEWGWAKFNCTNPNCGKEFHHFGAMDVGALLDANKHRLSGKSKSVCLGIDSGTGEQCNTLVEPTKIIIPKENPDLSSRHLRREWHCSAYNCFRRKVHLLPNEPIIPVCVHPASLQRSAVNVEPLLARVPVNVLVPAVNHVSTGSTVKTFLTQSELAPPHSPYVPSCFGGQ
ncbi:shiftless antiviral inhibitor of ribosomal frameshifting protein homolog isoform X5 [Dreissena polymorpha]|uniref:shiftless antiviral inhibitor of ribosomal frameshifting protein homolog isoform X4 n=1 Tax=Dreissena polymorpha TaxID=45954 RepID=UPI0022647EEA|nr:shiftless antiviral inhibitor of ribosomal frameshifting protein homolog isoform X4 [Dreissena polymorpha]XP_052250847.1 shiftless antiviral inhibitor of ribosomal frameshifting protein homolog isoform X5 [Dreissena polymorpha]